MGKFARFIAKLLLAGIILGVLAIAVAYLIFAPSLPDAKTIRDVQLQIPLQVVTQDGKLIAEFGEMHRTPLKLEQVPQQLIDAIIATEDARFYEHKGVDIRGLFRAALHVMIHQNREQGGSTITMQVARNYFLTRQKTYSRKISEIFLSIKLEKMLSKEEILELYINKIYLGNRAYGVAAAAQTYYGLPIDQLDLAQLAMIAGLPKAPSALNPIRNPKGATGRRNHVLNRMRAMDFITEDEYQTAIHEPVTAKYHGPVSEVEASYIAEMVRQELLEQYGDEIYTKGLRAVTTINSTDQTAAVNAVRHSIFNHEERYGYRGPEGHIPLPKLTAIEVTVVESTEPSEQLPWLNQDEVAEITEEDTYTPFEESLRTLQNWRAIAGLYPALVTDVQDQSFTAFFSSGQKIIIDWDNLKWAKRQLSHMRYGQNPKTASDIVKRGDVIRIREINDGHWRLTQIPEVEAALIAVDPQSGAIQALVGGFSFRQSHFNRITQAERQAGSSFKPFIYAAGLEHGLTPASIFNDAPIVYDDPTLAGSWRPENHNHSFSGPTRLREGLIRSKNLVSIRLLREIGINEAIQTMGAFGFNTNKMVPGLSLALGSASVTPMEMAGGFSAFVNGGYKTSPYIIERIEDRQGNILVQSIPPTIGQPTQFNISSAEPFSENNTAIEVEYAEQVISPQTAYLIHSMLQDVVRQGTGRQAQQLGRKDVGGKTGSTNEFLDAWFCGFGNNLVTITWMGYDEPRSLGQYAATTALPLWIEFMKVALRGKPEYIPPRPTGLITVRIDPETGLLAYPGQENAIFETFPEQRVPQQSTQRDRNYAVVDELYQTSERPSSTTNTRTHSSPEQNLF